MCGTVITKRISINLALELIYSSSTTIPFVHMLNKNIFVGIKIHNLTLLPSIKLFNV